MTLEQFHKLIVKHLEGSEITLHALYRRKKKGLIVMEDWLTGLFEKGDHKKYFEYKLDGGDLPPEKECEELATVIAEAIRHTFHPGIILIN